VLKPSKVKRCAHELVNAKDCANVDTGIDVGASIQGIKAHGVTTTSRLVENDCLVVFLGRESARLPLCDVSRHYLGNENRSLSTVPERIDHDLVREDVEFLLLLA
jgi:hypothetical protein